MGRSTIQKGDRFGRLTVIGQGEPYIDLKGVRYIRWICMCDCGGEALVMTSHLSSGHTQSCGCIHREKLSEIRTTHGKSRSRLYRVWQGMMRRCYDTNTSNYKNYGARGIMVCDEWRNDFQAFYDWAMVNGYNPEAPRGECTIDRIDNDGSYEPDNCRWIGIDEQQSTGNKRKPLFKKTPKRQKDIEIDGVSKSMSEWCRIYKISRSTVKSRVRKGWDKVTAITTPLTNNKNAIQKDA